MSVTPIPVEMPIASLRLTLASPAQIRAWSYGEVTEPTTLHYQTQQPEENGLFCERIFGPVRDWTCACGRYKKRVRPGLVCATCGVELAPSSVRRERMGHITLVTPVAHPWYASTTSQALPLLLDLSLQQVRAVLLYSHYLVLALDEEQQTCSVQALAAASGAASLPRTQEQLSTITVGSVLDGPTYHALVQRSGAGFRAQTGAAALRERLEVLDLDALAVDLRLACAAQGISDLDRRHLSTRLQAVEAFRASGVQPAWLILTTLPVLPPELRPLVPLKNGHFAASDLNALYARIIHRNARVRRFQERGAPEVILHHEQRLLQEACDALFENRRVRHPALSPQGQPLKSLSDALGGKRGLLRRNLLGKRVDYSGRSVIVVGRDLSLQQCGLPTRLCLELFKPFLVHQLITCGDVATPRAALHLIDRSREDDPVLLAHLDAVMRGKVVLLNRAPTLHRLSIQAFEVVRTDGLAIRLHPLVCSAFNADFDGDQMAVHLPLSAEAQREARMLLLSTHNLRSPATGEPAISISQEMVLGLYYLTQDSPTPPSRPRPFSSVEEVMLALDQRVITLLSPIAVRIGNIAVTPAADEPPRPVSKGILDTTPGRLIFNAALPEALRFRNYAMTKEQIKRLVTLSLEQCDEGQTVAFADRLKDLGFQYATRSGISFALSDITVPPEKWQLLAQAEAEASAVEQSYASGTISGEERARQLIALWTAATETISQCLEKHLDPSGSLATIIRSGATKAKFQQIRQLSGIRGLMATPSGRILPIPVKSNYLEGLTVGEMFLSGSGARNGFMGRSLNTASTGHLTRKLVECGMEVWITTDDCGTHDGLLITNADSLSAGLPSFCSQITGRVLAEPAAHLPAGVLLDRWLAASLLDAGMTDVRVRSVLTCQASYGVCQRCYGSDLATGALVARGAAVGIVAGQSIGEPGTQLSMRAFHSGGIANAQGDIRQGLPRVIELFEGRTPKHPALLAPCEGTVAFARQTDATPRTLSLVQANEVLWSHLLAEQQRPLVADGDHVTVGTPLTSGVPNPHELLSLCGCEAAARFLVAEVQRVFRTTGVFLHDKHIECIVRQMTRFVVVQDAGDSSLVPGTIVDRFACMQANAQVLAQGGTPATCFRVLLGLTKVSLSSASWLAAASFQETTRVLAQAALSGQTDPLVGLKERLIVAKKLPMAATHETAGTWDGSKNGGMT